MLLADRLRRRGVRSVVIDLYDPLVRDPHSPAVLLARALGGEHHSLTSLHAEAVVDAVRGQLGGG